MPAPQRRGLDVALLREDSATPPARRLVATAFLTLLRALAADTAVVIAVDDLQWLDPPSAAAIEFALRRLGDEPVRVIFSMRADATGPARLVETLHELPLERVEIGPLSVAALHRILSEAIGRTFARPILVRIAEASGGNPFHCTRDRPRARATRSTGRRCATARPGQPRRAGAGSRARAARTDASTRCCAQPH